MPGAPLRAEKDPSSSEGAGCRGRMLDIRGHTSWKNFQDRGPKQGGLASPALACWASSGLLFLAATPLSLWRSTFL